MSSLSAAVSTRSVVAPSLMIASAPIGARGSNQARYAALLESEFATVAAASILGARHKILHVLNCLKKLAKADFKRQTRECAVHCNTSA